MEQLFMQEEGGHLIPVTLDNSEEQEKWESLLKSSCVLKVRIGYPSNSSKVKKEKIKEKGELGAEGSPIVVDAAKEMFSASTKKFISPIYDRMTTLAGRVKKEIRDMGYPYYGHDGEYIIPMKKLNQALNFLKEEKGNWDDLLTELMENWENIKEESLVELKGLGNTNNYPPASALIHLFSWFYTVKSIGHEFTLPDDLKEMDEDLYNATVENMKENLQATLGDLTQVIYANLQESFEDLANRLSPEGELKKDEKKRINKGAFEKAMELTSFILDGGGNVLGDKNLESLCQQYRALVEGDGGELAKLCKGSETVRKSIKDTIHTLNETLKANIEEGGRAFNL